MRNIKFVSYDGDYPNLCSGILVLDIDGDEVRFENCLSSGGDVYFNDHWEETVLSGEWTLRSDKFKNFTKLVNENIEHGCCGGCV